VFFAEAVEEDGSLANVFIQRRDGEDVEVSVSRRGRLTAADENGWRTMLLFDGKRYQGVPGSSEFNLMEFAEEGVPLRPGASRVNLDKPEMMATQDLFDSSEPEMMAELQWRMSAPITIFVLTLLAVPMARTSPREGRYSKIIFAILIYMVYSNLLGISRSWLEDEKIPVAVGMIWPHLAMVMAAIVMLIYQSRVLRRLYKRRIVGAMA
jgi:lipopolysaccharide export system permease protein